MCDSDRQMEHYAGERCLFPVKKNQNNQKWELPPIQPKASSHPVNLFWRFSIPRYQWHIFILQFTKKPKTKQNRRNKRTAHYRTRSTQQPDGRAHGTHCVAYRGHGCGAALGFNGRHVFKTVRVHFTPRARRFHLASVVHHIYTIAATDKETDTLYIRTWYVNVHTYILCTHAHAEVAKVAALKTL